MIKIIIIILLIVIIFLIYKNEDTPKELFSNNNYYLTNTDNNLGLKNLYNKEVAKNKLKDCTDNLKCTGRINYDGNWKETPFYNYLRNTPLKYDGL